MPHLDALTAANGGRVLAVVDDVASERRLIARAEQFRRARGNCDPSAWGFFESDQAFSCRMPQCFFIQILAAPLVSKSVRLQLGDGERGRQPEAAEIGRSVNRPLLSPVLSAPRRPNLEIRLPKPLQRHTQRLQLPTGLQFVPNGSTRE